MPLLETKNQRRLFISLCMLIAGSLCLHIFDGFYYNHDELQHIQIASGATLADVWRYSLPETHPPLGHFIRHFWLLGGDSVWHNRLLSLLFGLAAFPAIYLLGKEIGSRRVGLIAVALLSFAHHQLLVMGAVRNYSIGNLFLLFALIFLFRFLRIRSHQYAWGYAVTATCALLTAYLNLVVLLAFSFCALVWQLLKKNLADKLSILLFCLPLLFCLAHFYMQASSIQPYVETSLQSTDESYADSRIEQIVDYTLGVFKMIPGALLELNFNYTTEAPGVELSLLFLSTLVIILYLALELLLGKLVFQTLPAYSRLFLFASLLVLPQFMVLMYLYGSSYLLVPRRLCMFLLLFLMLYAMAISRLPRWISTTLIALLALVSVASNTYHVELTVTQNTWKKLQALEIRRELDQQDYFLFTMTGVASYFMENRNGGIYRIMEQSGLREDAFYELPDGGKLFYYRFWPCNNCDVFERFRAHLKAHDHTRPWFVFLLNRWETLSSYSDYVFGCFPQLEGARVLLGDPPPAREEKLELFMVALPYATAVRFFESKGAICRNLRPDPAPPQF